MICPLPRVLKQEFFSSQGKRGLFLNNKIKDFVRGDMCDLYHQRFDVIPLSYVFLNSRDR